jgi:hypothetical protein
MPHIPQQSVTLPGRFPKHPSPCPHQLRPRGHRRFHGHPINNATVAVTDDRCRWADLALPASLRRHHADLDAPIVLVVGRRPRPVWRKRPQGMFVIPHHDNDGVDIIAQQLANARWLCRSQVVESLQHRLSVPTREPAANHIGFPPLRGQHRGGERREEGGLRVHDDHGD